MVAWYNERTMTISVLVYRTIPTAPIELDEVTLFIACSALSPMAALLRRTRGAPTELMCDDWLALCDTFLQLYQVVRVLYRYGHEF